MRQEGATGGESNPDSDSEGETTETPKVTCGRPRRVNLIKQRDVPSLTRLPSPEHRTGDGDSNEDEECIILSTPVDTPASTIEEVQSTMTEPVTDLSSDIQTLPDQSTTEHESCKHEPEQVRESESDSDSFVPIMPRGSARNTQGHTSTVLWAGADKKHNYIRPRSTYQI